jgi:polyisoprenoid-binding protein YceI
MRLQAAAFVVIASLTLALAAAAAPPSVNGKGGRHPALAPAAPIWIVDKAASRLTFRGVVSGQNFDGVFKGWDAQIAFDPNDLKDSHAAVTIDVPSVVTGDPTRDQMLPTADWFSVAKFPKATFVTTAITQTGPNHYLATGDLRIRDAVRRVSMPFTLAIMKDVANMDGTLTIDRRQFGVGQGQFASPDTVAANVVIIVRLSAKKVR